MKKPRVLVLDIETSPIIGYVWGLWDNNLALNQIKEDWMVIAWSAKWLYESPKKMVYMDQRVGVNLKNEKKLLKGIWKLLNSADAILTQNGKQFDQKKLNARFVIHGMKPPKSYKHIDTRQIAKSKFGFTSNKLEYLSNKLCTKYKKLKHPKFTGFDLWTACLLGNHEAWKEMEKYNKHDVLALEELYTKLQPWDNSFNPNVYTDDSKARVCMCGSTEFMKNGFEYTKFYKYQRYECKRCGAEQKGKRI